MGKAFKISPKNLLGDWGDFEDWEDGASNTPTGWTKDGTPTIAQEGTIKKFGNYSLKLIGTSSNQKLYRAIDNGADYAGRSIKLGIWVYTAGAGVTITIDDGVGTTDSSAHTGGGSWEFLTVLRQLDTSATKLQVNLNIPNGITAYFDGCILVEGENLFTDLSSGNFDISEWKPSIDIKITKFDMARKQGIYIPEANFGGRAIKLRGNVIGADSAACRANFDTLIKALNLWKKGDKKDLYLLDDRLLEVFIDDINLDPRAGLNMRQFNISFIAEDPSERFISMLRKKQVISSSPTSFNLSYGGNVESKPIIYFIANQGGDITACVLENLTTGESLSFTGTVSTGNILKIDCRAMEVFNNFVDSIADFLGDFFNLIPGTNYLKFTGSNCTIKIDWYDRWFS